MSDALIDKAQKLHQESFGDYTWFGRCIFLSWYCERGTCDFCFRSTQKHKIRHPEDARRSLPSVVSEAALIKGLGWKLEFLTGGYGIYPFEEIVRFANIVSDILEERIWVNLGVLDEEQLRLLKPYVEGIVSSLETLEPSLHRKVCPDKPIEPYLEMIRIAKDMGFKTSFTLVIGIGERREDFSYVKRYIEAYRFDRVTIYALRPVAGTPYEKGPTTEELAWWIAQVRLAFPHIEIIAGTAIYRIGEISTLLRAGANAFTKLPATKLFNTDDAREILAEVKKAGRRMESRFSSEDLLEEFSWDDVFRSKAMSRKEKEDSKALLMSYLKSMAGHEKI